MALSLKHQAFVDEYLKDRNATQATIRAGYSAKTAGSAGHRLLKNVEIQRAITERSQVAGAIVNVTVAKVVERMDDLYTKALNDKHYAAAAKALEMQGRYLAMFTDNHRVTVDPEQRESRLRAILGIADRN